MKKIQLETLEKINEERKLNKETKEKVTKRVLKNFLFATGILVLFFVLKLMAINLEKKLVTLIYKEITVGIFIITLVLFEVAYKKDSDSLAITSIEMFFLSIITLLAPYILINRVSIYTSSIGVLFAIYYSIKNFIIYKNEKNKYLKEKNDIMQIIKKESKDELAQEQLEKVRKERERKKIIQKDTIEKSKIVKKNLIEKDILKEHKETTIPKKRGRPRKTTNIEEKTATTQEIIESKEEVTPPKRKRGRPKKVLNNE